MINLPKRTYYLILTLVGLLTYLNSFANTFVWDDEILIVGNGYIKSFAHIFKIFTVDLFHWVTQSNFYRPLQSLSLMFDYHLWHLNPPGYHFTNFILHLLNTFLIFNLVKLLSRNLKISFLSSLFFLVHPVHTQAVTYISGRADLLACFFILSSALLFVKNKFYIVSALLFISGVLSKEVALVLPFVLIIYDYCFGSISKNIKRHIIFLGIVFLYILLRNKFLPFSSEGMLPYSLWVRLINVPKIIIFYLSLLVLPLSQRIERVLPLSRSLDSPIFLSILLLGAICRWIFINKNQKIIKFFCLWFFINLLPVINIILPLNAAVSEHWLYIPSIGFFVILAIGVDRLLLKEFSVALESISYKFKMTILISVIAALGLLTAARNFEWRNSLILFESALKKLPHPDTQTGYARLHCNLGYAYLNKGLFDKAITESNIALKMISPPQCRKVHYQLAIAYFGKPLHDKAEAEFLLAIEADPNYVAAYYALGNLYKKTGQIDRANNTFNKMFKIKPLYPQEELLIKEVSQKLSLSTGSKEHLRE